MTTAVFTLAYLRVTQTYRWARDQAGFFADTGWLNQEDEVFAASYFHAVDTYRDGGSGVPAAWRIAFAAARERRMTAIGDALLGMNAHINRDLAYALASIGTTTSAGASHKADQDKVQQLLTATIQPLLDEIAGRFDPTTTQYGSLGSSGATQLIAGWREIAWHNAELLAAAPPGPARELVATSIEAAAATEAQVIVATNSYLPLVQSSGPRDAFCSVHHADRPPSPYLFGSPA